jgi:HPt (histidine-containing phosphotransfer) domain-containing protein
MDVNILIQGGVNVNQALELLGDMETYNETLQDFLSEIDDKVNKIREYKESQDMENYAILVHSLKSDSKYLGFTTLADLAYNHEMASKAGDVRFVIGSYDALINETNRILDVVKNYVSGNKAPSVTLVNNNEGTNKILVADDSNIIRNFVQKMVPEDYSVLVANDGEDVTVQIPIHDWVAGILNTVRRIPISDLDDTTIIDNEAFKIIVDNTEYSISDFPDILIKKLFKI